MTFRFIETMMPPHNIADKYLSWRKRRKIFCDVLDLVVGEAMRHIAHIRIAALARFEGHQLADKITFILPGKIWNIGRASDSFLAVTRRAWLEELTRVASGSPRINQRQDTEESEQCFAGWNPGLFGGVKQDQLFLCMPALSARCFLR
jgi:hypothetical protein